MKTKQFPPLPDPFTIAPVPISDDTETIVELANGYTLRSGCQDTDFTSGEWVRICDPAGNEIQYWHYDEWERDPVLVMGAIINVAAENN